MAKRRRVFAWSPLRELMKKAGAEIVSRDAVEQLLFYLEERAKNLTNSALNLNKNNLSRVLTKIFLCL